MIFGNSHTNIIILELVRCDVNDKFAPPQPRMSCVSKLAAYVIKLAAIVILKILGKQIRGIAARPVREALERDTEGFRIILDNCHNGRTEGRAKAYQFIYIKTDHRAGDIRISADYPMDMERVLSLKESNSSVNSESAQPLPQASRYDRKSLLPSLGNAKSSVNSEKI